MTLSEKNHQNKCMLYTGMTDDIDPNKLIGEQWSYALYINMAIKLDYDKIWNQLIGKTSISYHHGICEIEYHDDILLLSLIINEIISYIPEDSYITYNYIIKRKVDNDIKLYADTITEYIDKSTWLDFITNIFN